MEKYAQESPSNFGYDVFLSFRGEDTRHNFIGHLRKELLRKGINAFFDDSNLRVGEYLPSALSKAIEESKISIIVFSHNYASSTWCLDELVKIIECRKRNNEQLAFPIFYHVNPSDVRHQKNSYCQAMVAHQERFGKDSNNIQTWRSALSEAANLKGHHIDTGSEIDHIEKIVEVVSLLVGENPKIDHSKMEVSLHVGENQRKRIPDVLKENYNRLEDETVQVFRDIARLSIGQGTKIAKMKSFFN